MADVCVSAWSCRNVSPPDHATMPILFSTGYGSIPMTVHGNENRGCWFLTKPYTSEALLSAARSALELGCFFLEKQAELEVLLARHRSLTAREKEVMALVVRGQLNKQTGGGLGISEITVKAHRGRVIRKMRARSLAELVKMAGRLGVGTVGKD